MDVAVLGLGRMGTGIATRLLNQGYGVTAWNRSPDKVEGVAEKGARAATSVRDAVGQCALIITSLRDDTAVKQVCFEQGAIDALAEKAVLIDMSTVHPETSRLLAQSVKGGRFVDAPVLGSPQAVETGKATILLGGPEDLVNQLEPLWNVLSTTHHYCGPNGSATTLKLVANEMLIGGTALLSEGIVTAQANGIDNDVLRRVLGESPSVAPGVRTRFENVLEGKYEGWFSLQLADKDVGLFLDLSARGGVRAKVTSAVREVLDEGVASDLGSKDLSAVAEVVRRAEGVVRP